MPEILRTCLRTGCRWPAVASLSYRYATREVWLEGLPDEAEPAAYALCPHHAGSLTVPRGWQLIDRRTAAVPPREPAGRDLPTPEPAGRDLPIRDLPTPEPAAAPNRYAALSAQLPRLAAEHAAARAAGATREPEGGQRAAGQDPSPSPDGDPVPPSPEGPEEIAGQLAMPVAAEVGPPAD